MQLAFSRFRVSMELASEKAYAIVAQGIWWALVIAMVAIAWAAFNTDASARGRHHHRHYVASPAFGQGDYAFKDDRYVWLDHAVRHQAAHGHSRRIHRSEKPLGRAERRVRRDSEPHQTVQVETPTTYAVLPMGNAVPAFEENYPEQSADEIAAALQTEIDAARAYLIKTAHAGGVMARMGRELYLAKLRGYAGKFNLFGVFKTALEAGNIEQIGIEQNVAALNPKFVVMAAKAVKATRARGVEVGLFSGYRPAGYGVGGYANKYDSCHTYGVAGDFWGVEKNYAVWTKAALAAGLSRPHASSWERNHWQAVPDKTCRELRSTVTAQGPKSLSRMWAAADRMIDRAHGRTQFADGRRHARYAERRHYRHYRIARR